MNSPPDPLPLGDWQERFAAALLAPEHDDDACVAFAASIVDDGIPALARLRVYRNNSRLVQGDALGLTYAVVRRRVGEEFFARLAGEYRLARPSPRGDLHWIGAAFPDWLAGRLAGTDYEWLVDVARLEWACELALVAPEADALPLTALGEVPSDALAALVVRLAPSVQLVNSPWPIWSVWRENQSSAEGRPVDLGLGAEHVIVGCVEGQLALLSVPELEWRFASALAEGLGLEAALERAGLPVEQLAPALGRLFAEGLVAGLVEPTEAT